MKLIPILTLFLTGLSSLNAHPGHDLPTDQDSQKTEEQTPFFVPVAQVQGVI